MTLISFLMNFQKQAQPQMVLYNKQLKMQDLCSEIF